MGEEKTTGALGGADRALLYGTVATTGAAVMMLELLGTRIIGPFYGVSLYVWSSLISVALIALSLGYYLGGVIGNLQQRRARVGDIREQNNLKIVQANVPLGEMFGYVNELRSMSQGRANYSMEFSHYEQAPAVICEKIAGAKT